MESSIRILIDIYQIIFIRYAITACLAFLIFYMIFKNKWRFKKIQLSFPRKKDYYREIGYSIITVLIFSLYGLLIFHSPLTQYSNIYWEFDQMPGWYYILCFPIMFLIHDSYFYWMHRSMHHPKIFKYVHLIHHKSTNPSPWAAYSFHPVEAVFEAAILPILAFSLPLHVSAFGLFFLAQIVYNVYGHLGYELYPKGFNKHWFGKWINTSVHHNLHHKYFHQSYGLYFTIWDRLMGTMHPKYDESFKEVKDRNTKQIVELENPNSM